MKDENSLTIRCAKIAEYLGIHLYTVHRWIRNDILHAIKNKEKRWAVPIESFAQFLYVNPTYRELYEQIDISEEDEKIRKAVLSIVYTKPFKMYTLFGLAEKLNVHPSSVRNWVNSGRLKVVRYKQSCSKYLFRACDVIKFLDRSPQLKETYEGQIGGYFDEWELWRIRDD